MNKISIFLGNIALFFAISASAAPIAIDTMFVDNASASLTVAPLIPLTAPTTLTASTPFAPPLEITMGSFQSSILNITSNDYSLNIYSEAGTGGNPAPSGYVDGSAISVDFSSLRGILSYNSNTYNFALWPLTTTLDYGTYDQLDGTFDIGWSENLNIDLTEILSTSANLEVNLQGYLTTIPVPAAIWLFGSGILVLIGFSRKKPK